MEPFSQDVEIPDDDEESNSPRLSDEKTRTQYAPPENIEAYKVMCRHDRENYQERRVCRKAEPIIAKLRAGENRLRPNEFLDVCRYFLSGKHRARAVRGGRFSVGSITCVRGEK